jgi:hypothetical protein
MVEQLPHERYSLPKFSTNPGRGSLPAPSALVSPQMQAARAVALPLPEIDPCDSGRDDAMCWSATADLVAGAGIAAIGAACVARTRRTRDLPLAALPLLLGTHQIIESIVRRSGGGTGPATAAWAVIALPLPALWVPLGVLCAAPPNARRRLLIPFTVGVVTAASLASLLPPAP